MEGDPFPLQSERGYLERVEAYLRDVRSLIKWDISL